MSTVRVERCPECKAMVGEGTLYEHRQLAHSKAAVFDVAVHALIAEFKQEAQETRRLKGYEAANAILWCSRRLAEALLGPDKS